METNFNEKLFQSLEDDYHGDVDLFLAEIKKTLTEYKDSTNSQYVIDTSKPVVIELNDVSKIYKMPKEEIHAVKNVNLKIYEGEIVALVGPSGSGKSTILQMIGGLDKPTEGSVIVGDYKIREMNDSQLSDYRNKTIGFVFQFFYLQPYLNVQENVEIPLLFRGESSNQRHKLSQEAIKSVGLEDRKHHLPNQLSGGQTQRVAMARAIVGSPKILLADEPTANLDRETAIEIIDLLRKINKELKTTIIIVTHDNFIAGKADRIIKLSNGKIV